MPLIGGAIAGAGSIGGALIGADAASEQSAAAQEAIRQQMARLDALQIPDIEKQRIALQQLSYLGSFDPTKESSIGQQSSGMNNITIDPRLKSAQMSALQTLSQLGQTPFTDAEKADMSQMRRQVSGQEQARQNAILQSLAQRGMLGSGSELAARLSSSQASADNASQETDRMSGLAQQRMLQAVSQAGMLGGQMQSQNFDEQAKMAQAQDLINQFNTANQRDVQQRNTSAGNLAGATAQSEKQRINEANTNLANQQQQYNNNLYQQQFQNQFQKASGNAGMAADLSKIYTGQAANTGQAWANIGQGVGQIGSGIAKAYGSSSSQPAVDDPLTYKASNATSGFKLNNN